MYTEEQLIQQVIKGDSNAIRHLLQEYQHYIFTICNSVLRNKEESEEATQDTFVKIIKALPSYVRKGKLSTWMYSVAYRTSLDYLKKRKPTQELNGYDHGEPNEIEAKIFSEERKESISILLERLNPEDAGLIRMYYLEEMSMKELAETTGLSPSNVKVRIFRSRKILGEYAKRKNFFKDYQSVEL